MERSGVEWREEECSTRVGKEWIEDDVRLDERQRMRCKTCGPIGFVVVDIFYWRFLDRRGYLDASENAEIANLI